MLSSIIKVKRITINFEDDVKRHYENLGYVVKRGKKIFKEVGVPDWAIYDKDDNLEFMCEVKIPNGGLNINQIEWIVKHSNIEVKIIIPKNKIPLPIKRLEKFMKIDEGGTFIGIHIETVRTPLTIQ